MARIRAALARDDVVREPGQAIGMALRHPVSAGQPLPIADLTRPQYRRERRGGADAAGQQPVSRLPRKGRHWTPARWASASAC